MGERVGGGLLAVAVLLALAGAACGGTSSDSAEPSGTPSAVEAVQQRYPDIVAVALDEQADGSFDVSVTVSSPYDTPQRYADGWRVLTTTGQVLGTHTLAHDHAGEQPFTRVQRDLVVPADVEVIVVEGRDQEYGFGGSTVEAAVPAR